ncbi:hypothetical protein Scep_017292 [Stephania cephalantha]|uniref:Uncharacterized protein n=1 Tax=Stephania cephalantha TaxID=152367 RepID=A0AAP0NUV7_9MAGN
MRVNVSTSSHSLLIIIIMISHECLLDLPIKTTSQRCPVQVLLGKSMFGLFVTYALVPSIVHPSNLFDPFK